MPWTLPRLLAQRTTWFADSFDYTGPACYELGTGGPRGGSIEWHYVGETLNERRRMIEYAMHGSHLSDDIAWHLRNGWCLYYRACALSTKVAAVTMQNNLLARWEYDWNTVGNRRN